MRRAVRSIGSEAERRDAVLKKMVFNIGGVSCVLASIMLLSSLSTLLLGNKLDPTDFGRFGLMRTLILFIPPLAIWGQDIATARFFSQNEVARYRWDSAFIRILAVSAVLIVPGLLIARRFYDLNGPQLFALFPAAIFYCGGLLFSNLLRSQGRYIPAILILSGFRGLFFFVLLGVVVLGSLTLSSAILSYIGVVIVVSSFGGWFVRRRVKCGSEPVPREMHTVGLILMGIEISVVIMGSLDALLIPKFLGYEALALYMAALVPGQVFRILNRAAKYVWVPEFGRGGEIRFKSINAGVAAVALLLLLALVLAARPILDLLYSGRYNEGTPLLRLFACVGFIRLFYALNSSLIVGRMSSKALKVHFAFSAGFMAVYGVMLVLLLSQFGVLGAALALLAVSVLRLASSYWILFHFSGVTSHAASLPVK